MRNTFPTMYPDLEFQPELHAWWSLRMTANEWDGLTKHDEWAPQQTKLFAQA